MVEAKPIPLSATDTERIREHLDQLLAQPSFAPSRRSQAFLRYVVEETLAGRGAGIKERNIAVDVFARGADFDSQSESIVRVNAAELRKRLAAAYADSSLDGSVRIEIPVGTYQPEFHLGPPATLDPLPPALADSSAGASRHNFGHQGWLIGASGAFAAGLILAAVLVGTGRQPSSLDRLWSSFAAQDQPVLIALPSPTMIEVRDPDKWLPIAPGALIPADLLRERELYYVGTGAAFGSTRFGEQLALRHQRFVLKFGSDVSFSDLHQRPAILLGAYTSQLTMEMTKGLRFQFDLKDDWNTILDSAQPGRMWRVARPRDRAEPRETYSVVTRLINSDSGHPLLMAAGMDARGTQAAADFLTNASYFDRFARVAGPDWPKRNFQLVLHAFIHGHSPGSPTLVTWHEW